MKLGYLSLNHPSCCEIAQKLNKIFIFNHLKNLKQIAKILYCIEVITHEISSRPSLCVMTIMTVVVWTHSLTLASPSRKDGREGASYSTTPVSNTRCGSVRVLDAIPKPLLDWLMPSGRATTADSGRLGGYTTEIPVLSYAFSLDGCPRDRVPVEPARPILSTRACAPLRPS
jgi:hypothetical protein